MNIITRWSQRHSVFVKSVIVVLTVAFVSVVLMAGSDATTEIPAEIAVGAPAPQDFIANQTTSEIPDDEKTARAQNLAADNVPAPLTIDNATTQVVINDINRFYADLNA